jgi:hypothetical protein
MTIEAVVPGGGVELTVERDKYLVLLQDFSSMDRNAKQFAYVIGSSDRTGGRGARSFEVRLDEEDGFPHPTIVDGRWVYTTLRTRLTNADYLCTLRTDRMGDISVAILIGLQLDL